MNAPPTDEEEEDDTRRAAMAAAIIGAVLAMCALGFYGARSAFSVVIGAAIAVLNLLTMRAIIRALIHPGDAPGHASDAGSGSKDEQPSPDTKDARETGRRGGAAWGVFAIFKILILFGGVWILLTREVVDPIPLVVGYGVLPLGILASALWSSRRTRQ